MAYAGHRPGAGSYECEDCAEVIILTDNTEELPPCPYCNNISYMTIAKYVEGELSGSYQYDLYNDEPQENTVRRFYSGYF